MFSRLYGTIIKTRIRLYENGVFKSFSLGVPIVSIGNITVGGTGKTPLVALVAEILAENGFNVCILSRGYGRENPKQRVLVSDAEKIFADAREAGDEPFELARQLLGKAVVVADANRVAAAIWAREKFGITAFVLDDAFQHLRVRRDANIVAIDATNPFGNGKLLPSGILREPLSHLKRADAIIITRANLAENVADLKLQIKKFNSFCPIFVSENKTKNFIELKKFLAAVPQRIDKKSTVSDFEKSPKTAKCFAFCGLGNPNNFFEQLRRENLDLAAIEKFPDHHFYTSGDIAELEIKARRADAEILLTTAKDAVKLKGLKFDSTCFVVESEMLFQGENKFRDWLTAKVKTSQ